MFDSLNQRTTQENAPRNEEKFFKRQRVYVLDEKKKETVEDFNDENQDFEVIDDYYVDRDNLNYYNTDEVSRDHEQNEYDTSIIFTTL